ncbi:MAG: class D sortase [Oscillospiraceae bacterium]
MAEKKERKKIPAAVQIIMPFFVTVLCSAAIVLAMLGPSEKIKTWYKVAFMDENKTIPQSDGIAGLNIVETDIDTDYRGETVSEGSPVLSEYGSQCAVLECKALNMYVPVYWGLGSELLEKGAVNSPASAIIGAKGNTVISAHVNTFFSNLSDIKENDEVILYTDYGRFTYKVRDLISFKSSDKKYLKMTEEDVLTLYTCEMNLLSESDIRVGAVCTLEKKEFYKNAKEAE